MVKLLLVDCDGTIREPKSRKKFITHPTDQQPIAGAKEAIAKYHNNGYTIIGISNQGGVSQGYKTLADTVEEQANTLKLIPYISCIYFCPDMKGEKLYKVYLQDSGYDVEEWNRQDFPQYQSFRKPGSGMLKFAIDSLGEQPEEIWYVGDREEDEQAATAAQVNFIPAADWRLH